MEPNEIWKNHNLMQPILNNEITLNWSTSEHNPYNLTEIEPNSSEYEYVENLFKLQGYEYYSGDVTKVERIENPYLLGHYLLKKDKLEKLNGTVNEQFQFHGTNSENIDGICKNNFNWRLYNKRRNGRGVNFSPSAHFAHYYGNVIFLVRVLIGRYTRGNDSTIVPPEPYDTTTDTNGNVYVKYEDDDFYPQYIIHYKCDCIRCPTTLMTDE